MTKYIGAPLSHYLVAYFSMTEFTVSGWKPANSMLSPSGVIQKSLVLRGGDVDDLKRNPVRTELVVDQAASLAAGLRVEND